MKWPWARDQRHEDDQQALEEAQERLAEVRGQWPRVEAAVEAMRQHRQRNHFAENIHLIYTGRRP
jgi:hypothetical protein